MQFRSLSEFNTFAEFWHQPHLASTVKEVQSTLGCSRYEALMFVMQGSFWELGDPESDDKEDEEPWRRRA